MKKYISYIIFFIGVLLMAYPYMGQYYVRHQQNKLMEEFVENSQYQDMQDSLEELQSDEEGAANEIAQDNEIVEEEPITQDPVLENEEILDFSDKNFLGLILIPKIDVKLPILEGTSKSTLSKAVGHLEDTPKPGTIGNTALAGHRSHSFAKFFNRLDEVEVGDDIYLNVRNGKEKYVVYDKFVVKPTDVWVLKNTPDKQTITLITCHPLYTSKKRLIVKAEKIED